MARRKRSQPRQAGHRFPVRRRGLLVASGVALAGLVTGLWRLLGQPDRSNGTRFDPAATPPPSFEAKIFPDAPGVVFSTLVDAIVPRFAEHPAASEIDLLPRLERCIALSPDGPDFFRDHWHDFEQEIRRRVPFRAGRPEPDALHAVLEQWHREYVRERSPSLAANYFEGLRRNVLLAYYTSPAGWASVGYGGPAGEAHSAPSAALG